MSMTIEEILDEDEETLDVDPDEDTHLDKDLEAYRQKLWYYLFRNMDRTIDELYCMCELESSIDRCDDAIKALTSCKSDFEKVIL